MDNTYRFGRIVVDFPPTANYRVQVLMDGQVVGGDYRDVSRRGHVNGIRLTDAEMDWLIGFDEEVAAHDAQWAAFVNR